MTSVYIDTKYQILQQIDYALSIRERLGKVSVMNGQGKLDTFIEILVNQLVQETK